MRRTIDTAPKDGQFVILEDDESGSLELAQWGGWAGGWVSAEARGGSRKWRAKQDHADALAKQRIFHKKAMNFFCKMNLFRKGNWIERPLAVARVPASFFSLGPGCAPTDTSSGCERGHCRPAGARAAQGKSEREPRARRWFAVSSIRRSHGRAALIGWYFHAELAAYVTRYSGEPNNVRIGTDGVEVVEQRPRFQSRTRRSRLIGAGSGSSSASRPGELTGAAGYCAGQARCGGDPAGSATALDKERRRADAPANEQTAQLSQAAETATAELRQALQKERDRAEALAGELAKARRDIETQLALPSKARDQAAQRNQGRREGDRRAATVLKTEHDRAEALTGEACKGAAGPRDAAGAVKQGGRRGGAGEEGRRERDRRAADSLCRRSATGPRRLRANWRRRSGTSRPSWRCRARRARRRCRKKKAAESATAELRQSLQKEHDKRPRH